MRTLSLSAAEILSGGLLRGSREGGWDASNAQAHWMCLRAPFLPLGLHLSCQSCPRESFSRPRYMRSRWQTPRAGRIAAGQRRAARRTPRDPLARLRDRSPRGGAAAAECQTPPHRLPHPSHHPYAHQHPLSSPPHLNNDSVRVEAKKTAAKKGTVKAAPKRSSKGSGIEWYGEQQRNSDTHMDGRFTQQSRMAGGLATLLSWRRAPRDPPRPRRFDPPASVV